MVSMSLLKRWLRKTKVSAWHNEHLASVSLVQDQKCKLDDFQKQIENLTITNRDLVNQLEERRSLYKDKDAEMQEQHKQHLFAIDAQWKSEMEFLSRNHKQKLEGMELGHESEVQDYQQSCSRLEETITNVVTERDAALSEVAILKTENADLLQKGNSQVLVAEVESLRVVLGMKADEIKQLRCTNLDLQVKIEKLDTAFQQAESARAKNEELQAQLHHTRSLHRTAETEAQQLRERTGDLDRSHQQLVRDKEELQWLLQTPGREQNAAAAVSHDAITPHRPFPVSNKAMSTPGPTWSL
eukprot:scpid72572/ scgid5453/ 